MKGCAQAGWGKSAWLLVLLVGWSVCLAGDAERELTAVRTWPLGGVTRIAIETNGPVQYRAERLSNPERLFFDLLNTVPREERNKVRVIPVGDELLKQIRVALTRPGVTRVVLDLNCPADYQVSQLANPHRVMIELRRSAAGEASLTSPRETRSESSPTQSGALPSPPPVSASQLPPEAEVKGVAIKPAPPPVSAPQSPPATSPTLPTPGGPQVAAVPTQAEPTPRPQPDAGRRDLPLEEPHPTAGAPEPGAAERPAAAAQQAPSPPLVARAGQRDSRGHRSLIRALGLKVSKVVLDPGHGGHDTGTIGPTGLKEKDLVLDLALRLGKLISERMGSEVIYTRTEDVHVPLETRTELANQSKADLFLSIHANSSRLRAVGGPETFYLNFTTSPEALEVAARENAPSARNIHELQDLILKIAQKEKIQESREFATSLQKALYRHARGAARRNRGVKKAPFVVLIGAQMPSVLVEVGFLSNPKEERLLKQPEYRQKLAEALYRGLFDYASTLSHFQLARGPAQQ